MNEFSGASDQTVLAELGRRLARLRLNRNLTQAELAHEAGVSKRTIERMEAGQSTQLSNAIRVLRALDLLPVLDRLLPAPLPSPLQQWQLSGRVRQRASARRPSARGSGWTWGDEAAGRDDDSDDDRGSG